MTSRSYYDNANPLFRSFRGPRPVPVGAAGVLELTSNSVLDMSTFRRIGCEFEAPLKSIDMRSGLPTAGDLERRRIILDSLEATASEAGKKTDWLATFLRRMSCHALEGVASAVRQDGKFSLKDESLGDDFHHDALFVAYCGIKLSRTFPFLKSMLESEHPIAPPEIAIRGDSWIEFHVAMTAAPHEHALKVVEYAHNLTKFLIPSYIYRLGSIPNPQLFNLGLTSTDVEDLYHDRCENSSAVIAALERKNCKVIAGTRSFDQKSLAYSIHVLLRGLINTEMQFFSLLESSKGLLRELDASVKFEECASGMQYILDMRRFAIAARQCVCGSEAMWEVCEPHRLCRKPHDFWNEQRLIAHLKSVELSASSSKAHENEIRNALLRMSETQILSLMWEHSEDQVSISNVDSARAISLNAHHARCATIYNTTFGDPFLEELVLGTDTSTSNPIHGEGYDRIIEILTATFRKIVLGVRLCHENILKMNEKFWQYFGGERSVITIPHGTNVIVIRESRGDGWRIVDIGLSLNIWYSTPKGEHSSNSQYNQWSSNSASLLGQGSASVQNLKQYLVDTAEIHNGNFMLHGFCDGVNKAAHDVKIVVTTKASQRHVNFEDLEFHVRLDNESAQQCTIIVKHANEDTRFLRFGILLQNTGLSIPPNHIIRESGESLAAALEVEMQLRSHRDGSKHGVIPQTFSPKQRSGAMLISPAMLELLPLTEVHLHQFLAAKFGAEAECLMLFYQGITVLGFTSHQAESACYALSAANFHVHPMTIDGFSFASAYNDLEEKSQSAGLTIVKLKLVTELSGEQTTRLVNLTRNTSLRIIVEVSPRTTQLFSDPLISVSNVQGESNKIVPLAGDSPFAKLTRFASDYILSSENSLTELSRECEFTFVRAERHARALDLRDAFLMASEDSSAVRLAIVVKGDYPVTSADDSKHKSFVLDGNSDHHRIQELIWSHPNHCIVVAVSSLDPSSIIFYEGRQRESTLHPVVFRPDQVVRKEDPNDFRISKILGCRSEEVIKCRSEAGCELIEAVRVSLKSHRESIPTFQAFVALLPLCGFLSHRARVALYFHHIICVPISAFDQSMFQNIFVATIWGSLRREGEAEQEDAAFLSTVTLETRTEEATDAAVMMSLTGGGCVDVEVVADWLSHHPSPLALQQYISFSFTPFAVIALAPKIAMMLLQSQRVGRCKQKPLWALRLVEQVQSTALRKIAAESNVDTVCFCVAKWCCYSAGMDEEDGMEGIDEEDVNKISSAGIDIDFGQDSEDADVLQSLLGLNTALVLEKQPRLKQFLTSAPSKNGISEKLASKALISKCSLGAFFVSIICEAESDCTLTTGEVEQLLPLLQESDERTVNLLPARSLLTRFSAEAWAELILLSIRITSARWERLDLLLSAIKSTMGHQDLANFLKKIIQWSEKRHLEFPDISCVVTAYLALQARFLLSDELVVWPLSYLDKTPRSIDFVSSIACSFVRAVAGASHSIGSDDPTILLTAIESMCAFVTVASTSDGRRNIMALMLPPANKEFQGFNTDRIFQRVYAVLWMFEPLMPAYFFQNDEKFFECMVAFLGSLGDVQLRFAETTKDNLDTVSPLALGLIGRKEYAPLTMFSTLLQPRLQQSTTDRPHIEALSSGRKIIYMPRPLDVDHSTPSLPQDLSNPGAILRISSGLSYEVLAGNLKFLLVKFSANDLTDVQDVVLWCASIGLDSSSITNLLAGHIDSSQFLAFLESGESSVAQHPIVLGVHLLRPLPVSCRHAAFGGIPLDLTACLSPVAHEDWDFFRTLLQSGGALQAAHIEGFATISRQRFSAAVARSPEFANLYASEIVFPCKALQAIEESYLLNEKLSILYCTALSKDLSSYERGVLAIAAHSILDIPHVTIVLGSGVIPKAVYDFLDDKLGHDMSGHIEDDSGNALATQERGSPDFNARSLTVQRASRIEFPGSLKPPREDPSCDPPTNTHAPLHIGYDDIDDDMIVEPNIMDSMRQVSQCSIDVSLILQIEWNENENCSIYLSLVITPGAECYLVDDGTLTVTTSPPAEDHCDECKILYVFKNHGEAWAYLKSHIGPISLVGKGFFLYRSKSNSGGWRFFIGRSTKDKHQPARRFHFWQILAYHSALCLSMTPALQRLLTTVVEEIAICLNPNSASSSCSAAIRILADAKAEDYEREVRPVIECICLLIEIANSMRGRKSCDFLGETLESFQALNPTINAPHRVGVTYDVLYDAMVLLGIITPGSITEHRDDDPSWFHQRNPDAVDRHPGVKARMEKFFRDGTKEVISPRLTEILTCIRQMSSVEESKLALAILREQNGCEKLKHIELAFTPLPIYHVWATIKRWHEVSSNNEALLLSDTANAKPDPAILHNVRQKIVAVRAQQCDIIAQSRLQMPPLEAGEGIRRLRPDDVEHCWPLQTDSEGEQSESSFEPVPYITWKGIEVGGLNSATGTTLAYLFDTLLCSRCTVSPEVQRCFVLRSYGDTLLHATQSDDGTVTLRHESGEDVTVDGNLFTFVMEPDPRGSQYRLLSDSLALTDRGHATFSRSKPSEIDGEQYFEMEACEPTKWKHGPEGAHLVQPSSAQSLLFSWVITVIESPISQRLKVFFVHHMHVDSQLFAPADTPVIAYALALLCPDPALRAQLLGSLNFSPTPYCVRRANYGIIVTPRKIDLRDKEWEGVEEKIGPAMIRSPFPDDDAVDAENFRVIINSFSLRATHVVVEGASRISNQLLKWCCEHTLRYPWRWIIFSKCNVQHNSPEHRDRVVDMNNPDEIGLKPQITTFKADPFEYFEQRNDLDITNTKSSRVLTWTSDLQGFLSEKQQSQRLILLVSPPGSGKTTAIKNAQFMMSSAGNAPRFVYFDCSSEALVEQALVSLLDHSVDVDGSIANVVLVADEYHTMSQRKKLEFLRWASTKLDVLKIVLIANRDGPEDEKLNQQLQNVARNHIIWRARVSSKKVDEALSTIRFSTVKAERRAHLFLLAIRLFSDDIMSLRMIPDLQHAPYSSSSGPTSPIEKALTDKVPGNSSFVFHFVRAFDSIFDAAADKNPSEVFDLFKHTTDPLELITFSVMLPTLLRCNCDSFASFVEFVSITNGYGVHPIARLASWISYIVGSVVKTLRQSTDDESQWTWSPSVILDHLQHLDVVDHPSFFPLIVGRSQSKTDLWSCTTLVNISVSTLNEEAFAALVRHDALDWSTIKKNCGLQRITSLDSILKMANPSVVAPELILNTLHPENTYGLLQKEFFRDRRLSIRRGERHSPQHAFRDCVLQYMPRAIVGSEGLYASPYFWSLWNFVTSLSVVTVDIWASEVEQRLSCDTLANFLFWISSHGGVEGLNNASQIVAARTIAKLADGCFGSDIRGIGQHERLWRGDLIARLAHVRLPDDEPGDSGVLGLDRVSSIARCSGRGPHRLWPTITKTFFRPQHEIVSSLRALNTERSRKVEQHYQTIMKHRVDLTPFPSTM